MVKSPHGCHLDKLYYSNSNFPTYEGYHHDYNHCIPNSYTTNIHYLLNPDQIVALKPHSTPIDSFPL
jgi:ABC-type multidrug transport system permease subunit